MNQLDNSRIVPFCDSKIEPYHEKESAHLEEPRSYWQTYFLVPGDERLDKAPPEVVKVITWYLKRTNNGRLPAFYEAETLAQNWGVSVRTVQRWLSQSFRWMDEHMPGLLDVVRGVQGRRHTNCVRQPLSVQDRKSVSKAHKRPSSQGGTYSTSDLSHSYSTSDLSHSYSTSDLSVQRCTREKEKKYSFPSHYQTSSKADGLPAPTGREEDFIRLGEIEVKLPKKHRELWRSLPEEQQQAFKDRVEPYMLKKPKSQRKGYLLACLATEPERAQMAREESENGVDLEGLQRLANEATMKYGLPMDLIGVSDGEAYLHGAEVPQHEVRGAITELLAAGELPGEFGAYALRT